MIFAIHQHESATGAHVSPHLNPPSHFPPHPIPLGYPRAPALRALIHKLNLHWLSILHMVVYTFQSYSLKSSLLLLPLSPKVCSLLLCLPCCLAGRITCTIFLDFIYMFYYMVFVFLSLTYFTPYNSL